MSPRWTGFAKFSSVFLRLALGISFLSGPTSISLPFYRGVTGVTALKGGRYTYVSPTPFPRACRLLAQLPQAIANGK
jgi:hypothetical protein